MSEIFSTGEFEAAFTYQGNDLGAVWSCEETVFRLWAPTAEFAYVKLYRSGTPDAKDLLETLPMKRAEQGTWIARKSGNQNGVYYTFQVQIGSYCAEACDPYAKATGVNGHRAMVIDLNSTNPAGWDQDRDPNFGIALTDAVIYELHIRDLSMHSSSGIQHKGKFLGVIETGTKTAQGIPTGLDHIKQLGITHLHLLPVYDFGSVDEAHPEKKQYNWGYDPVNYNVPEGSYSTDPFNGAVRIREMKQMVKGLHDNGISVIMDVVYNHVYHAEQFCFNRLVPMYFTRINDGVYSNGSGCGNDTASERSMVRKFIVDSICYWADAYHIDGFRFDLAGLLDIDTINSVITQVRKKHPNVIFYGEGWELDTVTTKQCKLATQANAALTPGFAYFNDTFRDALRGSAFHSRSQGFVTGALGAEKDLESCFRGLPCWCINPCQSINYISCHDNNTLFDRISLSSPDKSFADHVRMNKLGAAFCLTAQGVPFMMAGEEMLRSKPDPKGGFVDNSYCSPDHINSIRWDLLHNKAYRNVLEYYKGLIAFRKAHRILRMGSAYDVLSHLVPVPSMHSHVLIFQMRSDLQDETAQQMYLIFSAAETPMDIPLPEGQWQLFVDGERAGTVPLALAENSITVAPLSAAILVRTQEAV